ncbi:MAG: filamentous hemagglutinin N-terminal domain-containing protein, partial [Luteolibacter sp.]
MKPKRFYFRSTALFGRSLRCGAPVFGGFTFLISGLTANAGDILRGGGVSNSNPATAGTNNGGGATPATTDAARANAQDSLARTTRALDAVRAMQTAARNAALNSAAQNAGQNPKNPTVTLPNVPNGLGVDGLLATGGNDHPTNWTGANAPTQTLNGDKTEVTIKQTTQQALLGWQTFNVGKKTTLTFDQTAGGENASQWIAFNKISDPTGNPTQILGSIKATGQVYIINQNGIIFGGSSQVNARGLTVSSLPINDNLVQRGLLNNPDAQFLFSGLAIPAGINGTPAFTPEAFTGEYGDVIVNEGAQLNSTTDASKTGGRITLVGANVTNNGSITTPNGQSILASGLQVGFTAHDTTDASLRGLDIYVGSVGTYAGTTNNSGIIESARGSITIAGKTINQAGALTSTTSVSLNGRIDIQAQYNSVSNRATASAQGALFLFQDTGAVNLASDSMMSILPEFDSKETTIGTELALRSQVSMVGKTIRLGVDSIILAPNAVVGISAGTWLFENFSPPRSTFLQSGGQVYFEQGSVLDVAGSLAVPVSVSQNIISLDLRSAELADSPLQRIGILRNATVQVDIRKKGDGWIGTPLADVSGFANLIQRSVGQLTVAGGSVTISAGDSVVMQAGSNIAVSGGSTQFEGGMTRTTQLITGGHLVDISSASPDVVYDGIYDGSFTQSNSKFGVSNVFGGVIAPSGYRYEAGYTDGAAGGKLSISAPSMALDGRLIGTTVVGANQRLAPPAKSALNLSFKAQDISYPTYPIHSPTPPTITFDPNVSLVAANPFAVGINGDPLGLRADRTSLVVLSTNLLVADGFGSLTLDNHDGAVIVPEGVDLAAPIGGDITFKASNITVNGSVTSRGGSLSFSTYGITYDEINLLQNIPPVAPPTVQPGRGQFTLGSTGILNVSGLVVDDRLNQGSALASPVSLMGGTIRIEGYSAGLAEGGIIDVSGGASMSARGIVSYGNAGSLSITAGRELGFGSTLGGKLSLGADLRGFSGAKAGSLAITAPPIQIGGSTSNPNVIL